MDWTKAKTILITVLLIANVFLLYLYMNFDRVETGDMLQDETIALLEKKQIYLKENLPKGNLKMAVLMVEYDKTDKVLINEMMKKQKPLENYTNTINEDIEIAEEFMKNCGYLYDEVVFDRYDIDDLEKVLYFKNEYQGIKVEESQIKCIISQGVVTGFERYWLKPVGLGRAKKATISPSAALIELMRKKHDYESIFVERIEMIYWLDPSFTLGEAAVSDTALPTWKIEYNDGLHKYVPAFID